MELLKRVAVIAFEDFLDKSSKGVDYNYHNLLNLISFIESNEYFENQSLIKEHFLGLFDVNLYFGLDSCTCDSSDMDNSEDIWEEDVDDNVNSDNENQSDTPLLKKNFLGEFNTTEDKAKARENLDLRSIYKIIISNFTGGNYKKNTTVSHTFTWSVKIGDTIMLPRIQTITNGDDEIELDSQARSYTYTNIKTDTEYTLDVDGASVTADVKFYPPTFYGVVDANFSITPTAKQIKDNTQDLGKYGPCSIIKEISSADAVNRICIAVEKSRKLVIQDQDSSDVTNQSFTMCSDIYIDNEVYNAYILTNPANLDKVKYKFIIS